ncbi:MAG: hypothetical protein HQL16_05310 [Candidatus Omnitrophica bacterium]|nr:hypothetical protein [Candidatus Omnitrophota bacterium]
MAKSIHTRILAFGLFAALSVMSSGCVPLALVSVGAVGGYVVSPDTVEGTTARSLGEAMDAAKQIAGIMGSVIQANESAGETMAMIGGAKVTVTCISVNATTTKISVKARKSFMPKIDLAQDVYSKIINSMEK